VVTTDIVNHSPSILGEEVGEQSSVKYEVTPLLLGRAYFLICFSYCVWSKEEMCRRNIMTNCQCNSGIQCGKYRKLMTLLLIFDTFTALNFNTKFTFVFMKCHQLQGAPDMQGFAPGPR